MKLLFRWLTGSVLVAGVAVLVFLAFAPMGLVVSDSEVGMRELGTGKVETYPSIGFSELIAKLEEGTILRVCVTSDVFVNKLFGIERVYERGVSPLAIEGFYNSKGVGVETARWTVSLPSGLKARAAERVVDHYKVAPCVSGGMRQKDWTRPAVFLSISLGLLGALGCELLNAKSKLI